tara:strand:+ start:345 stop:605 length:261 start_codon:yes stop_codon:yes gene_type:complete
MSKQDKKSSMYGKAWKTVSTYDDYNQADEKRVTLSENKGVQVKIRRSADGKFNVKLRPIEQSDPAKKKSKSDRNKKQKKSARKNKE